MSSVYVYIHMYNRDDIVNLFNRIWFACAFLGLNDKM